MADTIQKGTQLDVGIGDYTYTGYITEDVSISATGEIEVIKGEDNSTTTKLISDKGESLSLNLIIKDGTTVSLTKGDTVTINLVVYMVEDVTINRSRSAAKLSLTLVKEDSMTYTA